jgi:hypothetical protein
MCPQANALPNPQGLVVTLKQYLKTGTNSSYIGCFKSGAVITDHRSPWYEPAAWKFGGVGSADGSMLHNYILHATANGYALSRSVAIHLAVNADLLAVCSACGRFPEVIPCTTILHRVTTCLPNLTAFDYIFSAPDYVLHSTANGYPLSCSVAIHLDVP